MIYKILIYRIYWTGDKSYFSESDWMTESIFNKVFYVVKKPSMFGNKNFSIKVLTKESN